MSVKRLISWPKLRRMCAHRSVDGREDPCMNPTRRLRPLELGTPSDQYTCSRDECPIWNKLEKRDAYRKEAQKWYFSKNKECVVRAVYTAVADQYDMIDYKPNFIPCLAVEGEKGYYPMRGCGEGATPWYWGETYKECQEICDKWNEDHFGISPKEAAIIVAGTMRN